MRPNADTLAAFRAPLGSHGLWVHERRVYEDDKPEDTKEIDEGAFFHGPARLTCQ